MKYVLMFLEEETAQRIEAMGERGREATYEAVSRWLDERAGDAPGLPYRSARVPMMSDGPFVRIMTTMK
ncbi:hypothetical protein ACU635_02435 [[Actinomadura] parvosata]|uniref:hypothetical protein n=1 Tax=[Actinomadura] parvosata TaxID=1955412 RepID=UPI00406C84C4